MRTLIPLTLIATLSLTAGCAGVSNPRVAGQKGKMESAAATPLYDINVLKTKIPVVLLEARDRPYQLPTPITCTEIANLIAPLDEALGPDLDLPPNHDNPGLLARGGGLAQGALENAAGGLIPLRGWVRMLSGAERYDQLVKEAIVAGGVRRGFLKGLGQAGRCRAPASPAGPALAGEIVNPIEPARRGPQYPIK